MTETMPTALTKYSWPKEGVSRVPYWVYLDQHIYEMEQEKIFRGSTWNYVGLEAELPSPGDFKTTAVGDTPVIITRDKQGQLHAIVNKCAHRGARVCRSPYGNATHFTCIYHQWNYDLKGDLLRSIPQRSCGWRSTRRGDARRLLALRSRPSQIKSGSRKWSDLRLF